MINLVRNQSHKIKRAPKVSFTFNDEILHGHLGESLAVALLRAGKLTLRNAPSDGKPRGMFCCMGLCQECLVNIDEQSVEACRQTVEVGLSAYGVKYST